MCFANVLAARSKRLWPNTASTTLPLNSTGEAIRNSNRDHMQWQNIHVLAYTQRSGGTIPTIFFASGPQRYNNEQRRKESGHKLAAKPEVHAACKQKAGKFYVSANFFFLISAACLSEKRFRTLFRTHRNTSEHARHLVSAANF